MRALKIAGLVLGGLIGLLILGAAGACSCSSIPTITATKSSSALSRPPAGRSDRRQARSQTLSLARAAGRRCLLGNPAGYGTEPFLTVKHADVGVKLLPLLRKEVEVRRVTLDGLAVNLVSRSEERTTTGRTWRKPTKPKQPDRGATPADARSLAWMSRMPRSCIATKRRRA